MLRYEHPWLAWVVSHWPLMIYLPTIVLVLAGLALLTRWWDKKDALTARERTDRAGRNSAASPSENRCSG